MVVEDVKPAGEGKSAPPSASSGAAGEEPAPLDPIVVPSLVVVSERTRYQDPGDVVLAPGGGLVARLEEWIRFAPLAFVAGEGEVVFVGTVFPAEPDARRVTQIPRPTACALRIPTADQETLSAAFARALGQKVNGRPVPLWAQVWRMRSLKLGGGEHVLRIYGVDREDALVPPAKQAGRRELHRRLSGRLQAAGLVIGELSVEVPV